MSKYLDDATFTQTTMTYKTKPTKKNGQLLAENLTLLTEKILYYAKFKLITDHKEEVIQRCVYKCFNAVERFKPNKQEKGAFPYFTTVILNHCRKEYRRFRDENEQSKLYKKFLVK